MGKNVLEQSLQNSGKVLLFERQVSLLYSTAISKTVSYTWE